MSTSPSTTYLTGLLLATALCAGCSTPAGKQPDAAPASSGKPAADKPAAVATNTCAKVGAGMNERGEVTDSKKVEIGCGRKIKGIDDYEGEVLGKPAPGSKFGKMQMGMELDKVVEMLGEPAAKGTRMSATMFNPFYFGSDKYKRELVYKGMGRLVFGERGGWVRSGGGNLIWIIHNANEPGEQ